ncbi:hypothetical protein Tco_0545108 [Tanacetum coccineum]
MDLLSCMKKKIGNGLDTSFWEEAWRGDSMFKVCFPRVYALELNKRITVADKLNRDDLGLSLRRRPRDGVELEQFNELKANIEGVELPLMKDRWSRFGLFNPFHCANCNKEVESTNHVFFACSMARDLYHKIASWWDINYSEFSSYEEWLEWLLNMIIQSDRKKILEVVFYVMWWFVWSFRNKSIFGSSIPSKAVIFDDLISRSYY